MSTPINLPLQVKTQGWAVAHNIGLESDNSPLIALGQLLGKTSWQGTKKGAPNLENDGVNRVENMDMPMRDAVGNAVLSSNADEFPLHTDDSYSPDPARYVLMHCWQADPAGGGVSWLAHIDHIIALAPPDLIQRLATRPYAMPYGQACVLWKDGERNWRMRFNRRDMVSFAKLRSQLLNQQQREDLACFESQAMHCVKKVALQNGDCVVVDNQRMLHGRSAFDPNSGRLIKRLRIL
jgi:alpha-ketoglutarate-dependent taurine dioxygenase